MIRNYFVISLRNLRKHFSYTVINIAGLSLGFATCILLVLWILHESSYDKFHDKADQIYRSSLEYSAGGQTSKTSVSPTALLPFLKKNFAEVIDGVRVYNPSARRPFILKQGTNVFEERHFFFADSAFFKVFSFALLAGDRATALTEPQTMVITESTAKKYFGNQDPIGKTLEVNGAKEYLITGVAKDSPDNTTIDFDFIASFSSLSVSNELSWWTANYTTYVLLAPNTNVKALEAKNNELIKPELGITQPGAGDYAIYNFLPLTDIHLRSGMQESAAVGREGYLYLFGGIALLVLLIASINYINLATARAADRAKEVGVRKVAGALRTQLFLQFMGDSILLTFIALILGFSLAGVTLPFFNDVTGKSFSFQHMMQPEILTIALACGLFVALAAGAYPALAITTFKPITVLKGNFKSSGKGLWLRKSLVIVQFAVSVILVVGTLTVLRQLDFMQEKELGYSKDNVIMFPLDDKTMAVYPQIKTELLKNGVATSLATATESPTNIQGGYTLNYAGTQNEVGVAVTAMAVDADFIPTLGMELTSGRNFTIGDNQRRIADTTFSFVLNQSALRELSIAPEKAIGEKVNLNGRSGEIIGVLKDFHFASLHEKISPLVLFNEDEQIDVAFVRLKSGSDIKKSIASFEQTYKSLVAHRPVDFTFLDDQYDSLYQNEARMSHIGLVFATLAIIIACLGLLGLVSFTALQKTKEIGIRKVLGASSPSIVILITREFTNLVIIALLVGLPLSWWVMREWLDGFAYKTDIGILPMILAALGCLFIAFVTAGYQAVKAALINPAETLKNE